MKGSKACPYMGCLEKWKSFHYKDQWHLTGFLFDDPNGGFPGGVHRTGNILILNEITGEVKTVDGIYKLGRKAPII